MEYVLRVDTPAEIRERYGDNHAALASAAVFFGLAGAIALVIQIVGHSPIGAAVCIAWILFQAATLRYAVRRRQEIQRWLQPVEIGQSYIKFAHEAYWKLTPETRASYGLPLVNRMYTLSVLDVRGRDAIKGIEGQMRTRWFALNDLVDAEDKQRLYGAEPLVADRDDVDAAQIWQQAVDGAVSCLRDDLIADGPSVRAFPQNPVRESRRRPPPDPIPGDPRRQ